MTAGGGWPSAYREACNELMPGVVMFPPRCAKPKGHADALHRSTPISPGWGAVQVYEWESVE